MIALPLRVQAPPAIKTLMVYLDEDCNLRCSYCFVSKKRRRMSAETADKVASFLFRDDVIGEQDEISVNFFGGEPFMALDPMEQLVGRCQQLARQHGKRVFFAATTNGTLTSPRIARVIEQARMTLLVSLDGDRAAATERRFACGRESHDLVVANLEPLRRAAKGRLVVRTTFHPSDFRLRRRVEFLVSLGVGSLVLCPVLDADWQGHEQALEREYQDLADWFIAEWRAGRTPPLELTWMLLRQWHWWRQGGSRPARPCEVGATLLGIDPDGNVLPCHRFLYRRSDWLGTVESPDLLGESRRPYLELDSSQLPDCSTCAARPVCGGGCRAVALSRGAGLHDVYSSHCITMRAHARAADRIYRELSDHGLTTYLERGQRMVTPAMQEFLTA